ncbi:MAG: DsrE family protein [Chloroflexi bacterium]|nr:DsrE family protein [Chloroflexota bacterium]MCI0769712.1 DsrE family protein [Chloroflexota bacterium]
MSNYLMIASRDCFEYADVGYFCNQAQDLAAGGNDVTLFLVQNAVLMARKGIDGNPLAGVVGDGSKVEVLADGFCLKERGVKSGSMLSGVKVSDVDHLVDLLTQDGVKAVWH